MSTPTGPVPDAATLRALISGLEKLPRYSGVSFRGRAAGARFGVGAPSVVSPGLTATSRDVRVATENLTTRELYAVVGTSGRGLWPVSQQPHEQEVVFLPYTLFSPVETLEVEGVRVTIVEQLEVDAAQRSNAGDWPLERVRGVIQRAVRAALAHGPVEVTSPGKFLGDID